MKGECIRVTGTVQGVGFRPTVWRLARECGVVGEVCNDSQGVLIHAWANADSLEKLVKRLWSEPPPLASIDGIVRTSLGGKVHEYREFRIVESRAGDVRTGVAADAATCSECLSEVLDPGDRRYRYPFTNCTHCGPRLSIVHAIPYDRGNTSMAAFQMCRACRAEYEDPSNRRFHAQPNACPDCGPRVWLEDSNGLRLEPSRDGDAVAHAAQLLRNGSIVAIKGIGGFHLACDAGNDNTVDLLRQRKHRYDKPFALLARDIETVAQYAEVSPLESELLHDRTAPIVVLAMAGQSLAEGITPGQNTLGFMLPYSPLHHVLMHALSRPIVLTSGNRSDEPQTISNDDARQQLHSIADYFLLHDRDIVNRLDDSVLHVADHRPRPLRRARGYAPHPVRLPASFAESDEILAMGGELKNTFCLLKNGEAILSQHIGDLEDAATFLDYRKNLELYHRLYEFRPSRIAVDLHPGYFSTQVGRELALADDLELVEVQHHHAHIAACMAEHQLGLESGPVLGVALDGLGFGDDGTLWGGEFLLADYAGFRRLARFEPVPMPGGTQAIREPWRNTWAHLQIAFGWVQCRDSYTELDIVRFLDTKPLNNLEVMAQKGLNSPLSSSCGRLFDAVAAALGVCRDHVSHEAQAAIELEALATPNFEDEFNNAYPHSTVDDGLITLNWRVLWEKLLDDVRHGVSASVISARFHQGLVRAVTDTVEDLHRKYAFESVVLGGGVFQNRLLLEGVSNRLRKEGFKVLSPECVPANDGGLALGQMVVAARGRTSAFY